jgi:ankyrin repeat protein
MAYHLITKLPRDLLCILQGFNVKYDHGKHTDHFLTINNSVKGLKYLVSQGADITQGYYAVCHAAAHGHLEMVKYLVSQGADVRAKDDYAVRWAAFKGYLEVVKYLVSQGADITARNHEALRWAARSGHLEMVEYLKTQ